MLTTNEPRAFNCSNGYDIWPDPAKNEWTLFRHREHEHTSTSFLGDLNSR